MKLNPAPGFAAAALLLAGAGGAALAHPHADGAGEGKQVERIVVVHDGKGGDRHVSGDRVRRFERHGIGRLADCDGGEKIVDEQSDEGGKTTKVIICRKGAPTAAEADRLEEALARLNDNDHLSDEQKARLETALRSAIERARNAR